MTTLGLFYWQHGHIKRRFAQGVSEMSQRRSSVSADAILWTTCKQNVQRYQILCLAATGGRLWTNCVIRIRIR